MVARWHDIYRRRWCVIEIPHRVRRAEGHQWTVQMAVIRAATHEADIAESDEDARIAVVNVRTVSRAIS